MTDIPQDHNRVSRRKRHAMNHQKSWLWGRYAVTETLTAGRWPIEELYASDELPLAEQEQLDKLCGDTGLWIDRVPGSRLAQLCGSSEHQGYLARMSEFPCGSETDLQQCLQETMDRYQQNQKQGTTDGSERSVRPPLFVLCDQIQDAHNFGAILRCCDGAGVDGIVIESHRQTSVTPHVARSSVGAVNYLELFRVDNVVDAAKAIRATGLKLVAATEKSEQDLWSTDLKAPAALVIGSEAHGIRPELLALCDQQLRIPMLGQVNSLNAAVAAGIVLYEIRRNQRVT